MQLDELSLLKQDATDKIIFHATPKDWLRQRGPWLLDRGEGAFLYDADGREYLDALSGGVFAVLAGYEGTAAEEIPAEPKPPSRRDAEVTVEPSQEQWTEIRKLIDALTEADPDTDWVDRARELAGGVPGKLLTKTGADLLTEKLEAELAARAKEGE